MRRLKWCLLKIWLWLTRYRDRVDHYIATGAIVQPPQGVRKTKGVRANIRKAIIESRPPKPSKQKQGDIDRERIERIIASRQEVEAA